MGSTHYRIGIDAAGKRTFLWWCPGCDGMHGVPVDGSNGIGKGPWGFALDEEGRPTITPSIHVLHADGTELWKGQPRCHSFIRAGRIEFLGDCEHALAGVTVDLPDFSRAELL